MPDGEQLSNNELKWAYWYLTHREQVHRWAIRSLIVLNILLFGFSGYQLVRWFAFDQTAYTTSLEELAKQRVPVEEIHASRAPLPLEVLSTTSIRSGQTRADFVARVRNPNPKWAMRSVTYHFEANGLAYPQQEGFLFPEQEKFLVDLNREITTSITDAALVIDNISWQRVNDNRAYENERYQFVTEDIRYIPPQGQGESSGIGRTVFTLTNASAYNFWSVSVLAVALQGDTPRAANHVTLDHVVSNERRVVTVPWFEPLAGISTMQVQVDVNVYDLAVFEAIRGGRVEQ